eukprot:259784_1
MTQKQKQDIIDQESKTNDQYHHIISSKILSKSKEIQKIDGINHLKSKQNKFQSMKQYQYGNRFYYWKWSQNYKGYEPTNRSGMLYEQLDYESIGDWYIEPKYSNIKSEMLCNDIYGITQTEWQCLLCKAAKHHQTKAIKNIYCPRTSSAKYYDMQYGNIISPNHVISMLLYCNYDMLSYKFSETYRKINEKDSGYDIKQRHRNYYWLGRYLRECAECFGMEVNYDIWNLKLYHGVNQRFTFESMIANIKLPFSTTISYAVAVTFCANRGMILELNISTLDWRMYDGEKSCGRLMVCDMRCISDFPNEEEIFCVGGACAFTFHNIIEPIGINYRKYMVALIQILNTFQTKGVLDKRKFVLQSNVFPEGSTCKYGMIASPSTASEKQLFFRLMSHQLWKSYPNHPHAHQFKTIPDYIENIMDLQFRNVRMGTYYPGCNVINDILLSQQQWIDFHALTKLLPNLRLLEYPFGDKNIAFLKNPIIYESVLSFVQSNKKTKLECIAIFINPDYYTVLQQYVIQYTQRFVAHGWNIYLMKQEKPDLHIINSNRNRSKRKIWGVMRDENGVIIQTSIWIYVIDLHVEKLDYQ